jgi:hypothetical protein
MNLQHRNEYQFLKETRQRPLEIKNLLLAPLLSYIRIVKSGRIKTQADRIFPLEVQVLAPKPNSSKPIGCQCRWRLTLWLRPLRKHKQQILATDRIFGAGKYVKSAIKATKGMNALDSVPSTSKADQKMSCFQDPVQRYGPILPFAIQTHTRLGYATLMNSSSLSSGCTLMIHLEW